MDRRHQLRLFAFTLLALVAAAAMTGRSSGNGFAQHLVAPATAPTPPNPYPIATGDTFDYSYRSTVIISQPNNKRPNVSVIAGTVTRTIVGDALFNGAERLDVRDAFTSTTTLNGQPESSGQVTTDHFQGFVRDGSDLNYVEYGFNQSSTTTKADGSMVTGTRTLTHAAPQIMDELPETKGASWSEATKYSLNFQSTTMQGGVTVGSTTTMYSRNVDGSFSSTITHTIPTPKVVEQRSQSSTATGQQTSDGSGPQRGTTVWGAVTPIRGRLVIPVMRTLPGQPTTTTNVPDWFPGNGPAPRPLVSDIGKDLGPVIVPSRCGVSGGMQSQEIRELFSFVDVVGGTFETQTTDRYVIPGMGIVCFIETLVLNTYDNLQTGALLSTDRTTVTQGLTGTTLQKVRRHPIGIGFGVRPNALSAPFLDTNALGTAPM